MSFVLSLVSHTSSVRLRALCSFVTLNRHVFGQASWSKNWKRSTVRLGPKRHPVTYHLIRFALCVPDWPCTNSGPSVSRRHRGGCARAPRRGGAQLQRVPSRLGAWGPGGTSICHVSRVKALQFHAVHLVSRFVLSLRHVSSHTCIIACLTSYPSRPLCSMSFICAACRVPRDPCAASPCPLSPCVLVLRDASCLVRPVSL